MMRKKIVPDDAIKRDPEGENCAVLTIAAQTANSIYIRVTFNAVTRYIWPLNQFLNQFNASLYFHLAKSYLYQIGKSLGYDEI